jgi:nitroimidazol reductase NimA-like FMN-containing flavoprotein (pyridoxamine 5'-phosphate oxidase superfamily)
MTRTEERTGLVYLPLEECTKRLAAHERSIGRVGILAHMSPDIFPVNYVMLGELIAFRTAPGTKLAHALRNARVTFEIDYSDPQRRTGWSVIVKGRAQVVTDDDMLTALESTRLKPFSSSAKDHWIVIHPDIITGRELPPGDSTFW